MSKKTIIFDFDGTLADSVKLIFDLYNEHAEEFRYLPLDWDEIPEMRRGGYKYAMKKKKIKFRRLPRIILTIGREMKHRMNEVKPYPYIVPLLKKLQAEGYSIGVLTSNQIGLVSDFFEEHDFPIFDFVVSEKTLFGKDKALRKIIDKYQLSTNDMLYVGDEPRDVQASHKVGVRVVGVEWGIAGKEGYSSAEPEARASTPKELRTAINTLLPLK